MVLPLVVLALLAPATDAAAPLPRAPLILLDDRVVKHQLSPALLREAAAAMTARTGVPVVMVSAAKTQLDPAGQTTLDACSTNACLADAGKKLGADVVVTARVHKREGVLVLTLTRVTALAELPAAEDARLARTPAELTNALADGVNAIFPSLNKAAPTP